MKIKRNIPQTILAVVIFFLTAFFCPCVHASNVEGKSTVSTINVAEYLENKEKDRILHVRGDYNFPPYEYLNQQGKPEGFNVDIISSVAKAMGITITIDLGPWDEVMSQLENGKIDALIGMFNTKERDKKFDFSIPHFIASYAVFVREGSPIQSLADAKNKKIIVQLSDLGNDYLTENNITQHIIIKKNWADVLKSLSNGEGDCAIVSRIQGTRLIGKLSITNIKAVGPPIIQRKYSLAVTEGNNTLLAKLNEGLSIIKETGTYDDIYKKWFGIYEEQPLSLLSVFHYLIWIILPLFTLAIAGFLWSWTLKRQVSLRTSALHKELFEHRRTEEALQESEARFRNLLENIPSVAVQGYDIDGTIHYWNQASEKLYGYTAQEAIGRNLVDLIMPDETRENFAATMQHIIETSEPIPTSENTLRHKDGSRVIVFSSLAIVKKPKNPPELFCIDVDITERKRTEEALRTSNELLSLFIKHSPIYAFIKEVTPTESRTLHASDNYRDMIGIPGSEMAGKTMQELFPPEFAAKITADDWLVVSRGKILRLDEDLNGRNYTTIKFPILLGGKRLLAGYTIDITERKRAEEALRSTNETLALFIKHSPIYAFIKEVTPTESRVIEASDNFQDMIGIPGSEMAGKTMQELFPPEFAAKITADDWLIASSGEILRLDEELNGRNYTTIKFPILFGGKKLLAGYSIDITERIRTEEELRRRENQLQKILEILPIGLWFAGKDGTLLRGNPMGLKIWGVEPNVPVPAYSAFKAWRLPAREPVKPDDCGLTQTIRNGVTVVDELLEIESFDGKRKTILNYTAPVLDDNSNIDGAIVVNLDISDRMALENQLIQAQKMESIGRLAGGVAHDFNNMLSVILGHTELAMDTLDPTQQLFVRLQNIREAAERSAALTRQLLAFARKQTVAPKMLDLNETVEGMLRMLERLIGENIDLAWLPGKSAIPVKMDPSQIDQILVNLCVNARDAISDTGKVTIETDTVVFKENDGTEHAGFVPGEYVLLAVSDNGCGMDRETLAHLFEPFFTTKKTGQGTGLGLATVYGIVKQNNGFINVYSEPGQGTTCRVYLPRHTVKTASALKDDTVKPAARGHETILVVEDEPMILDITTTILDLQGYNILAAATPGEAIRLAREHAGKIHLLITDVVMPEMNGRDLAKNLLSLYPNLKRLFMSGYTANVIAHHGVLDEGVHFIQKPFSRRDLVTKVRHALDTGDAIGSA